MQRDVQNATQALRAVVGQREVRWVPSENLHLTLKFLGDTTSAKKQQLQEGISTVAAQMRTFSVLLESVGCFPNVHKPRVIWVGLRDTSQHLIALHKQIEVMSQALGFATEEKPFHPHITLGRIKGHIKDRTTLRRIGTHVEQFDLSIIGEWPCTAISLMASRLTPSGSIYTCLYKAQLKTS